MIGVFDSGSGGLSVLREIRKVLPGEDYVYFADNAHCPYGEKSREYIIDRAREITGFLIGRGCRAVVVACNTATAAAISVLRSEYDIPFIGMEPAVKPAALRTRTGVIGVLATAGTLKGSKYLQTKDACASGVEVVEHVGKGFVELVEKGIMSGPLAEDTVRESVSPLIEAGADVIVLGCTHYPFLRDVIVKVVRELAPDREIGIIDPAPAVARRLAEVMAAHDVPAGADETGKVLLYASGDDTVLKTIFALL